MCLNDRDHLDTFSHSDSCCDENLTTAAIQQAACAVHKRVSANTLLLVACLNDSLGTCDDLTQYIPVIYLIYTRFSTHFKLQYNQDMSGIHQNIPGRSTITMQIPNINQVYSCCIHILYIFIPSRLEYTNFFVSSYFINKNPLLIYSTIRFGTASKATPQGRHLSRAGVGVELAIKRLPAQCLDH